MFTSFLFSCEDSWKSVTLLEKGLRNTAQQ